MAFTVTSFLFLLGIFFGEKERKAQGLAFDFFNLLYGYLSQQQHFIANPPLSALFKKELARFHISTSAFVFISDESRKALCEAG